MCQHSVRDCRYLTETRSRIQFRWSSWVFSGWTLHVSPCVCLGSLWIWVGLIWGEMRTLNCPWIWMVISLWSPSAQRPAFISLLATSLFCLKATKADWQVGVDLAISRLQRSEAYERWISVSRVSFGWRYEVLMKLCVVRPAPLGWFTKPCSVFLCSMVANSEKRRCKYTRKNWRQLKGEWPDLFAKGFCWPSGLRLSAPSSTWVLKEDG